MQEHWKPLNLLVQWQHATAWQIKLHEKSGCFLLHSSVSLFCDVRDKNVTWFFHFRGLHEFFKISFFLPTKCWSPTNSSEENLLDEIALIEFLLGAEADGNRETRQNTAMGFLFAKQKTLHVLTHLISSEFLATLSLPSLQDCAVGMNTGTGVDEFSFLVQFWHTVLIACVQKSPPPSGKTRERIFIPEGGGDVCTQGRLGPYKVNFWKIRLHLKNWGRLYMYN